MRRCNNCKADIQSDIPFCPLCQSKLDGDKVRSVFPKNQKRHKDYLLFKTLLFISCAIGAVCLYIDYAFSKQIDWSIIVLLSLVSNIVSLFFILTHYKNVLRLMTTYFITLVFLLFIWYFVTGNVLIINIIIPILCTVILLFNGITALILKDYYVNEYVATILFDSMVGFIPLILVGIKMIEINILVHICNLVNIVMILALIIFYKGKMIDEIKKRLST